MRKEFTIFVMMCCIILSNIYILSLVNKQRRLTKELIKFTLSASIKADEAGLRTDELYVMLEEIENEGN